MTDIGKLCPLYQRGKDTIERIGKNPESMCSPINPTNDFLFANNSGGGVAAGIGGSTDIGSLLNGSSSSNPLSSLPTPMDLLSGSGGSSDSSSGSPMDMMSNIMNMLNPQNMMSMLQNMLGGLFGGGGMMGGMGM